MSALAKALYGRLFDWLVVRLNESTAPAEVRATLGSKSRRPAFISLLDIFGFEILATNAFEQLCINYSNEMLQQLFNQHVFVQEQDFYTAEGIVWSTVDFQNNQACLDLIGGSPQGLLPLLDQQTKLGREVTDESYLATVLQAHLKPGRRSKRTHGGCSPLALACVFRRSDVGAMAQTTRCSQSHAPMTAACSPSSTSLDP